MHSLALQDATCVDCPTQSLPPDLSTGLLHCRFRTFEPLPQDFEQVLQTPHPPQNAFPEKKNERRINVGLTTIGITE